MQEEKQKEKSCENCKHYYQHYGRQGVKFRKIDCGLCLNSNVKNRRKKKPSDLCLLWTEAEDSKDVIKKSVETTIELMSQRLDELLIFLQNDAE